MQLAADAIALELAPATISRFNVIQCHMGYFELWNNFIEDFYKNANQSVPYQPGTVCFPSIEMFRYLPNNTLMMRYIEPLWRKV